MTALDDVDRIETLRQAARGFIDNFRDIAGLGVRHTLYNKETAFGLGQKVLDAAHAKTAFNGASKLFHFGNEAVDVLRFRDARTRRGLERLNVVFDKEFRPAKGVKLRLQIAICWEDPSFRSEICD